MIDKLHDLGIPHIVFTGGEPTLREDLATLIAHTQKLELVSGLVTNGRKLKDKDYLQSLNRRRVRPHPDNLESNDPKVHDKITGAKGSWDETVQGLKNAIATPIYTISNTTLNQFNVNGIESDHRISPQPGAEAVRVQQPNLLGKSS